MDPSNDCDESFIQVFDGPDTNATQLGEKICGPSNIESMESIGRHIFVIYTSLVVNSSDKFRIGINLPGGQNISKLSKRVRLIKYIGHFKLPIICIFSDTTIMEGDIVYYDYSEENDYHAFDSSCTYSK